LTLENHWLSFASKTDRYSPLTIGRIALALRQWEEFLVNVRGLSRPDRVKIDDFKAYLDHMKSEGNTVRTRNTKLSYITSYYSELADQDPNGRWPGFHAQLKAVKRPKATKTPSPHKPIPLRLIPEILEASKESRQDDYVLVACLIYTGLRARDVLGLEVQGLDFENRIIDAYVKTDNFVRLPMHKSLAAILQKHLLDRGYESDMVFRLGRFCQNHIRHPNKPGVYEEDRKSGEANRENTRRGLARVEKITREKGIDEHFTAHRFRENIGTYVSLYRHLTNPPMDDKDRRLLLAHGSKNITDHYDQRDLMETRDKWDQMDFADPDWIEMALNGQSVQRPLARQTPGGASNGTAIEELRVAIDTALEGFSPEQKAILKPSFDGLLESMTNLLNNGGG
jgi:integrase